MFSTGVRVVPNAQSSVGYAHTVLTCIIGRDSWKFLLDIVACRCSGGNVLVGRCVQGSHSRTVCCSTRLLMTGEEAVLYDENLWV
jgi:hypothetical protein